MHVSILDMHVSLWYVHAMSVTLKNGLTPLEQSFLSAYVSNGFNGTQAYLQVKPETPYPSATVRASEIVARRNVQEALQIQIDEKAEGNKLSDRHYLAAEAWQCVQGAKQIQEYRTAIAGIDVIGKLHRLYDRDAPDLGQYTQILQQLNVSVTVAAEAPQAEAPQYVDLMHDSIYMEPIHNPEIVLQSIDNALIDNDNED